jgi:hypothetical protein
MDLIHLCTPYIPQVNPSSSFNSVLDETYVLGPSDFSAPNAEATVIESLTLKRYHDICYSHLPQFRAITTHTRITVNLGAVLSCSSSNQLEDAVEVGSLPDVQIFPGYWFTSRGARGERPEEGWTRY